MPHTLNWREGGLFRTFTGVVTGAEIVESNLTLHGDHRFDNAHYVINDFSQIEDCQISDDELHMLPITDELATHANSHLKIALVVPQQAFQKLANGYCKMMRVATYDAESFENMSAARSWVESSTQ